MAKRKKKIKIDLRKPAFKDGKILYAKQLNDLWKDIEKLKRLVNK